MGNIIFHAIVAEFSLDILIRSTGSISIRVSALDHKSINNTMESKSVIKSILGKLYKICHCNRCGICIQFYLNGTVILDLYLCMMCSCKLF